MTPGIDDKKHEHHKAKDQKHNGTWLGLPQNLEGSGNAFKLHGLTYTRR
jgi:hypothetical protein